MKKITSSLILLLTALLLTVSCSYNERYFYNLDNKPGLSIWFGDPRGFGFAVMPNAIYDFGRAVPGIPMPITFHVQLMGMPAEYDRIFMLVADSGNINPDGTGQGGFTWEAGPYVLRAGQDTGSFRIYFDQPSAFTEFDTITTWGMIRFVLQENEYFTLGAIERSRLLVQLRNMTGMPVNWVEAETNFLPLQNFFGAFSNVKWAFIRQVTGMDEIIVRNTNSAEVAGQHNAIAIPHARHLREMVRRALQEYNEANPNNPMVDEQGLPIEIPA